MNPKKTRLRRLTLENFRCFRSIDVAFHDDLTVLVAENGRGKTAVLDAVGIAFGLFVDTISDTNRYHGFSSGDAHMSTSDSELMRSEFPVTFVADGEVDGQAIQWQRQLRKTGKRAKTTAEDALSLRRVAEGLKTSSEGHLPFLGIYGTGRLWSEHRLTEGRRREALGAQRRVSGYIDCLSSASSFKGFLAWYEQKMLEIGSTLYRSNRFRDLGQVAAVHEAVRVALEPTGWQRMTWNTMHRCVVVEHAHEGWLPLSFLSDGVRNMIALVADVAFRCAVLNPHLRELAAVETPGILVIDEVDMHLHPRWQQEVVRLLRMAFPLMQIIVSTHSPHVLSTVDHRSIRILRQCGSQHLVETPTTQTRGVMSADVLASIMGVDPMPNVEEAAWLSDYRGLIEDGQANSALARSLKDKLERHFGVRHPLLIDCERLIRFQDFRVRNRGVEM